MRAREGESMRESVQGVPPPSRRAGVILYTWSAAVNKVYPPTTTTSTTNTHTHTHSLTTTLVPVGTTRTTGVLAVPGHRLRKRHTTPAN